MSQMLHHRESQIHPFKSFNPDKIRSQLGKAKEAIECNHFGEAFSRINDVLKKHPGDKDAIIELCGLCDKSGNWVHARRAFNLAFHDKSTRKPHVCDIFIREYGKYGMVNDAREVFQTAHKKGYANEYVYSVL